MKALLDTADTHDTYFGLPSSSIELEFEGLDKRLVLWHQQDVAAIAAIVISASTNISRHYCRTLRHDNCCLACKHDVSCYLFLGGFCSEIRLLETLRVVSAAQCELFMNIRVRTLTYATMYTLPTRPGQGYNVRPGVQSSCGPGR